MLNWAGILSIPHQPAIARTILLSVITGKISCMSTDTSLVSLLFYYLQFFDKKINYYELQLVLQSSPAFPSLLSLKQTCDFFGLETKAYLADYDVLLENTLPVIVHWKTESEEKFVLVKSATPDSVTCYDATKHKKLNISKESFCQFWTGALLVSEKSRKQKVSFNNTSNRNYWIYGLAVLAILIVFLFGFQNSPAIISLYFAISLFVLKATGVWLTANIMKHEAGITYQPFESFCNRNEFFDCNKVLNSNASKIIYTISLAEIGTVYFLTGIFLILLNLLNDFQNGIHLFLIYGSLSALPFVLFSFIYQKFIIKKWCPFCLGVIGLILIENFVFLLFPEKIFLNKSFLFVGMAFVLSLTIGILIVSFFKKLLNAQADSFNSKLQSLRIKRNPVVLASVFGRQKIAEVPKNHNIVIGDSNAPFVITTLLSPMCKPCKKLAGQIIELLKKHPSCFYWQIRFDGIENNAGNLNKIQLQLMQLCNREKDENLKLKIISAWYSRQSFKWFSSKYPFQEISPEIYSSFAEVIIENKKFGFKKVPGLWVNDKELPSDYSVADLPYLTTDFKLFLHLTKQ